MKRNLVPKIKMNYYEQFKCIADRCSLTCCQEWRIAVDEKTREKWKGGHLNGKSLCSSLQSDETGSILTLNKDKKCPFLNSQQLCELVIQKGEDFLSDTCTIFPREIHEFENRIEYGVVACCPEVVDLMRKEAPSFMGKAQVQHTSVLYELRENIQNLMECEQYTLPERMMIIFYMLLDLCSKKKMNLKNIEEYRNPQSIGALIEAIKGMKFSRLDTLLESNELFLDIVENYRKQKLYVQYIEGIAKLAETLEKKYLPQELLNKQKAFLNEFSKYERLIKHYLLTEIFGSCLLPESNLEDVVIAFEWIVLEYAVIRQAVFLKWLKQGAKELDYETVRDYLVVLARVTGYDAGDIYEYLENSFKSPVWEWGYLALVVGNSKL